MVQDPARTQALDQGGLVRKEGALCVEAKVSAAEIAQIVERNARTRSVAARVVAAEPNNWNAQAAAARALVLAGAHELALSAWRRAAMLAPDNAEIALELGMTEQALGDIGPAAASFRRAIALAPNSAEAFHALTQIERQSLMNNHIAALERIFALPDKNGLQSLNAGHALAKTYEDFGDLGQSFAWLRKAKAIRARQNPYGAAREIAAAEAAMKTLGPANGFASEEPIFIVGMPRTGTSLVDRIVSSHAGVTSAGELNNFTQLMKAMVDTGDNLPLDAVTLNAAANVDFSVLGRSYVESTRPATGEKPRFIDKAPINYLLAGLIHRALPNARIICLARDPMDVCLSLYRQRFVTDKPYYNYSYDLANTARAFALHRKVVAHWREVLPGDRFTEVRYENVVADLEGEARRLIAFCGLEWDPRCLAFHENMSGISTPSATQVRQPLYSTSIGRWRKYGALLDPAADVLARAGIGLQA